jgi:succinate dehydrogenase / fumarate reductase, cytochrome b subunit
MVSEPELLPASAMESMPASESHSHGLCPRRVLTITGAFLALFVVFHLAINLLGLWPARFQAAVDVLHSLGWRLPLLEAGLVFIPLAIHLFFGVRVLWQDKLKYNVEKRRGSPLRQCLQQASALVLLVFLGLHLATLHRWFGGSFNPHDAFRSVAHALWKACASLPPGTSWNLVLALFYPVGLVAALYHWANGISTGLDIFGFTPQPAQERRVWIACLAAMVLLTAAGLGAWLAAART